MEEKKLQIREGEKSKYFPKEDQYFETNYQSPERTRKNIEEIFVENQEKSHAKRKLERKLKCSPRKNQNFLKSKKILYFDGMVDPDEI